MATLDQLINLYVPLTTLEAQGYDWVPDALDPEALREITTELDGIVFAPDPEQLNGVAQQFESWHAGPQHLGPHQIARLSAEVWMNCRRSEIDRLEYWEPLSVAIQRYTGGEIGIGAHRDFKRDLVMVAVFNITGQATFNIHDDEDRSVITNSFRLYPGDLVLLAGEGFSQHPRPVHSVTDLTVGRTSIAYRMSVP